MFSSCFRPCHFVLGGCLEDLHDETNSRTSILPCSSARSLTPTRQVILSCSIPNACQKSTSTLQVLILHSNRCNNPFFQFHTRKANQTSSACRTYTCLGDLPQLIIAQIAVFTSTARLEFKRFTCTEKMSAILQNFCDASLDHFGKVQNSAKFWNG